MLRHLNELWSYRELVWHLATLDLRTRYRGSFFGFLWTLFNPLLMMLVLWAVFSQVARIEEKNYALFLLSGLMVWTFFSQSIEQGMESIVRQGSLIQKIYIPKLVFPMAMVLSNLVNLGFFLLSYVIIAAFSSVGIQPTMPMLIPIVIVLLVLTSGGAMLMATLNVFFRDLSHLTTVLLRALFYVTPVIYPAHLFGEEAARLLKLNPLYYPVIGARDAMYYGRFPELETMAMGFAVGVGLFLLSIVVFNRVEDRIIYYV